MLELHDERPVGHASKDMKQRKLSPGPSLNKAPVRRGLLIAVFAVIAALGAYAYFVSDEQIEARAPNTAEPTMAEPIAVSP